MGKIRYDRGLEKVPGERGDLLRDIIAKLGRGDVLIVPDVSHLADDMDSLRLILSIMDRHGFKLIPEYTARQPGESVEDGFKRDLKRAATKRAKARNAYTIGRKREHSPELVRSLKRGGSTVAEIATMLNVTERTVYRDLKIQK